MKTIKTIIQKGIRWPIEAMFFYVFAGIFIILPVSFASAFGGFLCRVIAPLTPFHRRSLFNIGYAMPELTDQERREIAHKMWWHLGRVVGEYFHVNALLRSDRITFDGLDYIDQLKARGGFMISAHLGNWELGIAPALQADLDLYAVFRRINNPFVSRLLTRRAQSFNAVYEKGMEGAKGMASSLRKGGTFIAVVDQKLREGEMLDFFGHKASTAIAHIKMADKFDVPMLMIQVIRVKGCQFHIVIRPLDLNEFDRESPEFINNVAVASNHIIEGWIRENPEQWMWPHRRWPASKGEVYNPDDDKKTKAN